MRQFSRIVMRNSAFGLSAQLVIKLLSFGFSVMVVRHLGAESFGQYAAVLAFGALFLFLADLGLSPYAVREAARWRDAPEGLAHIEELFGNLLALRFLLALITAAVVIGAAWITGRPLEMTLAIALGTIGLLMYSAQGASETVMSGFERLDLVAGARVFYQIVFVVIGTVALVAGTGYYGLIGANLIGIAVMTLVCWRAARHLGIRPARPTPTRWPPLLRASLPFGLIGLTLGLSYKFDTVLLNIFRGDVETGYYNAAYNLVFSAVILSNVINTSLYPSLTRQAASDPGSINAIYARALRYLILVSLPIAVGACALADQLVALLYGPAYLPTAAALRIVIWVTPLMFASEFLGYVVVIDGKERRVATAILISTALNIGCNLLLVPRLGFLGASAMTVVTEVVLVAQYFWLLRAAMRGLPWGAVLVRPLLAAVLMGGVALALRSLPLLLNVGVSALAYGGLLVLLGVVGGDELRFVRSLRKSTEAVP